MFLDASSARSRLRDALGALRESLGAVSNLQELLRSRNIAPSALAKVLPDVQACWAPLQAQLIESLSLLGRHVDAHALDELSRFLVGQLDALIAGFDPTPRGRKPLSGKSLGAGERLGLERQVREVEKNLAAALPLLDLMSDASFSSRADLDILELLRLIREGDQPRTPRCHVLNAGLDPASVPLFLLASPRFVLTLIGVAGALVNEGTTPVDDSRSTLTVALRREPVSGTNKEIASLTIRRSTELAQHFQLLVPPVIAPTRACLAAVALTQGMNMIEEEGQLSFRWTLTTSNDTG